MILKKKKYRKHERDVSFSCVPENKLFSICKDPETYVFYFTTLGLVIVLIFQRTGKIQFFHKHKEQQQQKIATMTSFQQIL